jgi:glycosyltransferase involved in cell wall biosynthesis
MLAQTFDDWELVLVDDGSADCSVEVVEQIADSRLRLIRLVENRGTGHARQVALDHARGEFIAMLDADDWMYPTRLERQVDALRQQPSLGLVSAGMAVVDQANQLTGVRLTGDGRPRGPHRGVACPVAHASSMFRRSIVGKIRYHPSLTYVEDQDFLVHLLQGQQHATLPTVEYTYAEIGSVTAIKAARAQRHVRRRLARQIDRFPTQAVVEIGKTVAKEIAYRAGSMFGQDERIVRARSRPPSLEEVQAFHSARDEVESVVRKHFSIE